MIKVTRLDGSELRLNPELIESIESTPDTVISLTNGKKLMVRESPEVIVGRIIRYKRNLLTRLRWQTTTASGHLEKALFHPELV